MAYDENTVQRIREILFDKNVLFTEKKMFGGVCFMVDDKMCCGTRLDKKTEEQRLLCRLSEEVYEEALENEDCIPMDFTGKTMKGFLYVNENGFKKNKDLARWLQLCLDFNPIANRSKK